MVLASLVVVVALVDAVEALVPDAAPPAGDVGLVGASVHAAVTAHARPSQARTILVDIVQTAKARASDARTPGGESGIVALVLRSHRVPGLTPNRLSAARNALQNQGISLIDLTGSNPTRAGLRYPDDLLDAARRPGRPRLRPRSAGPARRPARRSPASSPGTARRSIPAGSS